MNKKVNGAIFLIAVCAISTGASTALAHEGHGLAGSHWHATDVWGIVVVCGFAAMAIWYSRKDK